MDGDSSVWRKGEQKLFFRRDACRGSGREDALSGFLFGMARYSGTDHMIIRSQVGNKKIM
jgi:hypothetical protein